MTAMWGDFASLCNQDGDGGGLRLGGLFQLGRFSDMWHCVHVYFCYYRSVVGLERRLVGSCLGWHGKQQGNEEWMMRSILMVMGLCGGIWMSATGEAVAQELPQPGPEHKRLAELAGDWETTSTTPGVPGTSKGTATYKVECNGLWVAGNFEGEFAGQKFQGKGLDSYDVAKKKYVSVWVDSMITSPMLFEGDFDEKTKTMTQLATAPGPDGKPAKWRGVTKFVDADHHEFSLHMTPAGAPEMLLMTMKYTRKK
jgi:hypothetical protein